MSISILVGLKNNLEYTKYFYETTRELYPEVEICFASYGSTDGTKEWLDSLNDVNTKYFYSDESKTFSDTFNKATYLATNEYVVYLHNDIVLAPNFIENLEKHVSPNNIVSYTTIEPPIFVDHERPGKIIKDFGSSLETFNKEAMFEFVKDQKQYQNKTELGITFFMCMPRKTLLEIGGLDNLFKPMFCEDDDLILRWKLLGLNCITSLDSICYHFVSKTSRFSDEYKNTTNKIELCSNRNFVRKWGFRKSNYNKKYNIAFVVHNCSTHLLDILEPWCSKIYIDIPFDDYIEKEQINTKFDLSKRILPIQNNYPEKENDIIVEFDANQITQQSFLLIQNLSEIIKESGEIGEFELDLFKIKILSLNEYQNELIHL
jgi:GT2 family glycosyltransferase